MLILILETTTKELIHLGLRERNEITAKSLKPIRYSTTNSVTYGAHKIKDEFSLRNEWRSSQNTDFV